MKVLGITGGVGAGKSTILAYLEQKHGARIIQADQVAFHLQQPGGVCFEEVVALFGKEILDADGRIDRGRLASVVFADSELLAKLNGIVHPAVKKKIVTEIEKERQRGKLSFFVIEAALLLEDHYDLVCDELWYIHTDPEVRCNRLMKSRGYSEEKVHRIMENQLGEQVYREKCQVVIDNSCDQVECAYEQIDRELAFFLGRRQNHG
ncbi:MAG: dephospho-CoA kinase [Lachnospiraceae bacterium]|nr:dephospho-CoA kinase [Lachnospiraceae bacterium]